MIFRVVFERCLIHHMWSCSAGFELNSVLTYGEESTTGTSQLF